MPNNVYGRVAQGILSEQGARVPTQRQRLDERQVQNNAGGYVYETDLMEQLRRFLILGSADGTYYVGAAKLTADNMAMIKRANDDHGAIAVAEIVTVSTQGRAPWVSPQIFALAVAATCETVRDPVEFAFGQVIRTASHLLEFVSYVDGLRGWGPWLRRLVASWYLDSNREPDALSYQIAKYRRRKDWTHQDVLKMCHLNPTGIVGRRRSILGYLAGKDDDYPCMGPSIWAYESMREVRTVENARRFIDKGASWEMIPTELLNGQEMLSLLALRMPLGALIRYLGRMTHYGVFGAGAVRNKICERIINREAIRRARLHPLTLLTAYHAYAKGRSGYSHNGESMLWSPDKVVMSALANAVELSIREVAPTNKRLMMALDISGSMWYAANSIGGLTCLALAQFMAVVTHRVEKNAQVVAFDGGLRPFELPSGGLLVDAVMRKPHWGGGRTDCAQPMLYALDKELEVDAFVVYTDNETWFGRVHPMEALRLYRERTGIAAKLIVVGMTATPFSIADPRDGGALDVVGFDTSTPNAIIAFINL